jgi:HEPN domain-containing protein
MASDRFSPDDPREWLNRARSNLAMARALVPDAYMEDLCYQAQQAAEKAIKAVMIQRDIEFPYTHNIERLLTFLSQNGEDVPETVWAAQDHTRFAFADRYPGNEPPLSEEDYRRNLAVAEVVVRWAEELIGT